MYSDALYIRRVGELDTNQLAISRDGNFFLLLGLQLTEKSSLTCVHLLRGFEVVVPGCHEII